MSIIIMCCTGDDLWGFCIIKHHLEEIMTRVAYKSRENELEQMLLITF